MGATGIEPALTGVKTRSLTNIGNTPALEGAGVFLVYGSAVHCVILSIESS